MKINKFFIVTALFFMSLIVFTGFAKAEEINNTSKEKDVEKIRTYLESNVSNMSTKFSTLEKDAKLEDIERIIENYYKENPAPKEMNDDNNISLEDVFPELTKKHEKAYLKSKGILNKFIEDQNESSDLGEVFTYEYENSSKVDVYLGKTGEISITEFKTVKEAPLVQPFAEKQTRIQRTTGISYNATGSKCFTLWAESGFKYDGKKVSPINRDADWNRHPAGSTINLLPQVMPKTRDVVLGKYTYKEVYARLKYESGWGIRWASVTMKSGTVESLVGCTVDGSIYGSAKRI
ncbi:hypothetical protein [Peribacillus muralis]|uniref:hypothetical protein n=1 Tax=Peribacillus muralis TaxID=264697 RepID=UPI003D06B86E